MALVSFVSAKGSPGVTTSVLALAAAWPRTAMLAETDLSGGDVAAGYYQGSVQVDRGVYPLARAVGRGADLGGEFAQHVFRMSPVQVGKQGTDLLWLPGLTDPGQAGVLTDTVWEQLSDLFLRLEEGEPPLDVLADCGRFGEPNPGQAQLYTRADLVVTVARPTLRSLNAVKPHLAVLRHGLRETTGNTSQLTLLLVGTGPYGPAEVAKEFNVPVVALPHDPVAASWLSDGVGRPARYARSRLARAARAVSMRLTEWIVARRSGGQAHAVRIPGNGARPVGASPDQPGPPAPAGARSGGDAA
ncbi:MAG: hypothetical protein ACJ73S_22215 [Mycobacteriales bacterium]